MIRPFIHMNGTSSGELERQLRTAADSIRGAIDAMRDASTNGRDYYPLGNDAYAEAAREYQERVKMLTSVLDDVNELAEHVADKSDGFSNGRR